MTGYVNVFCAAILLTFGWVTLTCAAPTKQINYANFEEIYDATKNDNILIIDVRAPQELIETGKIPNSINIPLAQVKGALRNTSADEFKKIYGKEKPTFDTPIIFSCTAGVRSKKAYLIADELGFKNLKNFEGGWLIWDAQIKEMKEPSL